MYLTRISDLHKIAPCNSYLTALLALTECLRFLTALLNCSLNFLLFFIALGLACALHDVRLRVLQTALVPDARSWQAAYPDLALMRIDDGSLHHR